MADVSGQPVTIQRALAVTWRGKPAVAVCRADGDICIVVPMSMDRIPEYARVSTQNFLAGYGR